MECCSGMCLQKRAHAHGTHGLSMCTSRKDPGTQGKNGLGFRGRGGRVIVKTKVSKTSHATADTMPSTRGRSTQGQNSTRGTSEQVLHTYDNTFKKHTDRHIDYAVALLGIVKRDGTDGTEERRTELVFLRSDIINCTCACFYTDHCPASGLRPSG